MFLDENATWWKSIKDGKCIWSVNERSPDVHQEKWEMKLLNIRINVTCQKQVLIKVRDWLLLLRLHGGLLLDLR